MITPIGTMTINQIAERKNDLLMSDDDIKEMAKNVRAKAIDGFAEALLSQKIIDKSVVRRIAEQLKEGV